MAHLLISLLTHYLLSLLMLSGTARATLTVSETAVRLGLGRNATYEAIRRGEVPSIRVGRRILVPRDALERWLAAASSERSVD